ERVAGERQRLPDRTHHALDVGLAGDGQDLRVALHDLLRPLAEAARDDDLARLGQRLADRFQRLLDGGRDEAAGVHDDELGVLVAAHELVTVGPEAAEDALAVDERLRAPQADEPHPAAGPRRLPPCRFSAYRLHAARESSRGLSRPAR